MNMTMWTAQTDAVMDVLRRDGVVRVQNRFIDQKYGDTAWIFRTAYRFLSTEMAAVVQQPEGAQSPFWLFGDPKWTNSGVGSTILKLEVPQDQLVLFDRRDWSQILNLDFLGTQEQKQKFEEKLRRSGLQDTMPVFQTAFYPLLKREILHSWKTLLQKPLPQTEYLQGACWELRSQWVREERQL